jgi:hypothetical protein
VTNRLLTPQRMPRQLAGRTGGLFRCERERLLTIGRCQIEVSSIRQMRTGCGKECEALGLCRSCLERAEIRLRPSDEQGTSRSDKIMESVSASLATIVRLKMSYEHCTWSGFRSRRADSHPFCPMNFVPHSISASPKPPILVAGRDLRNEADCHHRTAQTYLRT